MEHFTDEVLFSEKFYLLMNLDYDCHFQHTDWAIAWITKSLCWCVMLQISLIYIFSSLRVLDLCIPPLQVTLHVVARQSVHSAGNLLVCLMEQVVLI